MSTTQRDFQFNVGQCDPLVEPIIEADIVLPDNTFVVNSCGENPVSLINQSNVENDHLKGSEQISTESMQNSTDSKLSCAQKEMVIDKNFLEEWPNEATEKNKKAKVIIEQACKTKDVDAMIQICHKFREEFMVARFYIGVLMMEKEELEKKLTSLDDSLKDFVDDHNMTLNENHQLKEEILDLLST